MRLLTVEEAAVKLGIGRTFAYRLVLGGEIESVKLGKRRLVPEDAVDDYIARLRRGEEVDGR